MKVQEMIQELNEKADEVWAKMHESEERTHSLGYISGLEYAACRLRQILDHTAKLS